MGLKLAPIASGDILIGVVLLVGGVVVYRTFSTVSEAYTALPKPAQVPGAVADYVATRVTANNQAATKQMQVYLDQKYPDQRTPAQSWVADVVQKGQDAGASTFVTSFFTGLFK